MELLRLTLLPGKAPYGAVAAHLGAVGGLKVSMADSHQFADDPDPQKSGIRIHIKVKGRIRIRSKVKSQIRMRIKEMRVRNTGLKKSIPESIRTQCME
jgi:hypothetical protein